MKALVDKHQPISVMIRYNGVCRPCCTSTRVKFFLALSRSRLGR